MCYVMIALLAALAAQPPTKEQLARWVADLGDDRFAAREEASRRLWQAGPAAESLVSAATKDPDPEVARRARALMDKFRWGLYADTPPKVAELIQRYRSADEGGRQSALRELSQSGSAGCAALLKIVAAEDRAVRPRIMHQIALETADAVPQLLLEGKPEILEQLLEISIAADQNGAGPSYAACLLMRGKLDERIAVYQSRTEKSDDGRAAELLAYLCRAKGDLAAAHRTAVKAGRKDLEEAILYEAGDWKTLAKLDLSQLNRRPIEALGFRAAYQRVAGNTNELEATLTQIRGVRQTGAESKWDNWLAAKALFLNDRPQDALAMLGGKHDSAVFEVLCAQHRFREALDLVDKVRAENAADLPLFEILQARALHQLGKKEEAVRIFADLAGRIKEGQDAPWHENLIEAEYRLGLNDQAIEHCTLVLTATKNAARISNVLGKIFPGNADIAAPLWALLRRKSPGESPSLTLSRLRDIVQGAVKGQELIDLLAQPPDWVPSPQERARLVLARLELYLMVGMELQATFQLIDAVTDHTAPIPAFIRFGDYLAAQKKWLEAAKNYDKAWSYNRNDPLPLYLQGWALRQAGREEEGKRLIESAHWLPLGKEAVRFAFMTELVKRHHREAVRRECELLLRVGVPGSFYTGEAFRQLALDAFHRQDHLAAAAYHERAMLRCLRLQTSFQDTTAYLSVPHFVHRQRARGLLAAGRMDDALKEAELCLAALPGNTELQTLLVPELEKLGHKQEADTLFARGLEPHAKLCREYPASAWAHNSLAWLCAATRRNLDTALEHAQKAVALEPTTAGYHDTLAETYFRRGEQDKAIEEIKKSIALDGKRQYFKKQLKRFEAGNPKTELPPTADDE